MFGISKKTNEQEWKAVSKSLKPVVLRARKDLTKLAQNITLAHSERGVQYNSADEIWRYYKRVRNLEEFLKALFALAIFTRVVGEWALHKKVPPGSEYFRYFRKVRSRMHKVRDEVRNCLYGAKFYLYSLALGEQIIKTFPLSGKVDVQVDNLGTAISKYLDDKFEKHFHLEFDVKKFRKKHNVIKIAIAQEQIRKQRELRANNARKLPKYNSQPVFSQFRPVQGYLGDPSLANLPEPSRARSPGLAGEHEDELTIAIEVKYNKKGEIIPPTYDVPKTNSSGLGKSSRFMNISARFRSSVMNPSVLRSSKRGPLKSARNSNGQIGDDVMPVAWRVQLLNSCYADGRVLLKNNYKTVKVRKDSHCMFRAIAQVLSLGRNSFQHEVRDMLRLREQACNETLVNAEEPIMSDGTSVKNFALGNGSVDPTLVGIRMAYLDYYKRMMFRKRGDVLELWALSRALKRTISIFEKTTRRQVGISRRAKEETVFVHLASYGTQFLDPAGSPDEIFLLKTGKGEFAGLVDRSVYGKKSLRNKDVGVDAPIIPPRDIRKKSSIVSLSFFKREELDEQEDDDILEQFLSSTAPVAIEEVEGMDDENEMEELENGEGDDELEDVTDDSDEHLRPKFGSAPLPLLRSGRQFSLDELAHLQI